MRLALVGRLLCRPQTQSWPWHPRWLSRRTLSTPPQPPPPTSASRIARLEARLPSFLRKYTSPLRHAPVSHITAFLILHEITAIVPLFGLAALFHYTDWLPTYFSEGRWVSEGVERFGRWLRKRGFVTDEAGVGDGSISSPVTDGGDNGQARAGMKLIMEFATAYAITKALVPARIVLSVWLTPWFARWTTLPVGIRLSSSLARRGRATSSSAAGARPVVGGSVVSNASKTKAK